MAEDQDRPAGLLSALYAGTASVEVAGQQLAGDELAAAAGAVAHSVAGAGRVGLVAHRSAGTLVAAAGILAAGGAVVPLHPDAGPHEQDHIIRDAQVDLVLDEVDLAARDTLPPDPPADGRAAFILYTSGSTGPPKGAVLSRRAVAANLDTVAALWDWAEADLLAHALPLFHVHGLVFGGVGPLRIGSPLVHTGRYFRPVHGASVYFGVPALWATLNASDLRELRTARLLVSGAAALPQHVFERIAALSGQQVLNRYAMTETLIITSPRLDSARSPLSVGPPLPGVQVRLTGIDGAGHLEEVEVRSPSLFSGYLGDGAALAPGDWFSTGDLGEWQDDGSLRLIGRKSTDVIKTGGYRVGAGEVENALLAFPGVVEAAVAGLPDGKLGQRVTAWVVAAGPVDRAELMSSLAVRLAPYKRPLEIRVVESLPRNALGKVQKRVLIADDADEFSQSEAR